MAYPEPKAKYAGEARAEKLCRADGGSVHESDAVRNINDGLQASSEGIARGLNAVSRLGGLPYNRGAVGVQTNADMRDAEQISDWVPRRKEEKE